MGGNHLRLDRRSAIVDADLRDLADDFPIYF